MIGPTTVQPQIDSSVSPMTQTPPKHLTLVLSARPTLASSTSWASSWDTAPQPSGDQGYVSPLIYLYSVRDLALEALEDSPADREPVSYDDVTEAL